MVPDLGGLPSFEVMVSEHPDCDTSRISMKVCVG